MSDLRIDYDDDQLEIIDKVNKALAQYGLQFQDDMKEHDGFMLLDLVEKKNG